MSNILNLREKLTKSVLTIAVLWLRPSPASCAAHGWGERSEGVAVTQDALERPSHGTCGTRRLRSSLHGGIFRDVLAHLQHLSPSRYGSIAVFRIKPDYHLY